MDIKYVIVSNFMSFTEQQTIRLEKFPVGLNLITGENKQQPDLGSNGAGKSTILHAISFAIFGKTQRGVKAKNIRSWGEGGASFVKIGFSEFELYRQWNPNKLQINIDGSWQDIDQQNLIENYIGLDFDEFSHSVMFGQFNSTFLDLKPSEKLSLLDEVLDTQFWDEKSEQANKRKKEAEKQITSLSSKIETIESQHQQLEQQLEEYKQKANTFNQEKEQELKSINDQISEAETEALAIKSDFDEEELVYKDWANHLSTINPDKEQLDKTVSELESELNSLEGDRRYYSSKLRDLEEEIERLDKLENECPTCKQKVDKEHLESYIDELEQQADKLEVELEKVSKETEQKKSQYEQAKKERSEKKSTMEEAEKRIKELDKSLDKKENELEKTEEKVARLREQYKEKQDKVNPYNELVEQTKLNLITRAGEQQEATEEKSKFEQERDAADYWVKGFKELRSYVISSTLSTLEVSINNTLTSLGMTDWKIELEVEKESQTGNVQRGFYVNIINPEGEKAVWEAYSGGETQRLRMSVAVGISDAITSMKGIENKIMFIDEPSVFLNQDGIYSLMDMLKQHSDNTGKKIILIDHHSLDYGFDSKLHIEKDEQGISRVA